MIWDTIRNNVCPVPRADDPQTDDPQWKKWKKYLEDYRAYRTKDPVEFVVDNKKAYRHWIIGGYKNLKKLARDLRVDTNAELMTSFSQACFGRRNIDVPRTGPQPSKGGLANMTWEEKRRPDQEEINKRRDKTDKNERRFDTSPTFSDFYSKKTLEAHHIVEKSMLGALGRNKGELSDDNAPCVLVVAELHQQIFTPEIRRRVAGNFPPDLSVQAQEELLTAIELDQQVFFTPSPGMSHQAQADWLTKIYTGRRLANLPILPHPHHPPTGLYAATQMADLWAIAKIIIDHVRRE